MNPLLINVARVPQRIDVVVWWKGMYVRAALWALGSLVWASAASSTKAAWYFYSRAMCIDTVSLVASLTPLNQNSK